MDKIGYEYENNTSYLTIQAMENQKTGYQIKMLLNNDIPGLLDISMRSMNNQTYYYYDVTFKKPLSKLYEFGKMTWEDVVCICKSIDTLTKAVDMYLLDISCVLILPEYMYLNVSDKEIRYVYCPDANREFQTMLKGLFEFILEHYQHGTDCKNQMRVYEIYQKIIDGNYKIHCLEQLTKESSHSPEKEKTIEFPHIQQDEPVVIEEVAPERVVTEEEKQPVHKIWGIEVGIGICAVLTVYAAAVLLFPEMAVIDMSVYFCVFLILAGCAGGVFLQKKRKKLKEMGELTQLTQEKKYSFVPEEEEEPKNNEKGQKPYEPPKEAAGSNTILLSDYLQKKKDLNLTLVLQNGQELESYYEERLLPDTFPCAIGNIAAYCSIVIHSELISRLHACIYREDGAFYLEDMNSTNGTFLNGRRLLPKERQLLSDGDMVGFANLLYKVEKS